MSIRLISLSLAAMMLTLPSPLDAKSDQRRTWTADNGDGTFTNPLFYDEFSDPDMIRVGDWFYLTGTTMHTMPGLPVLRSRDLVNWEFVSYAVDKLDLGPDYRLEGGGDRYGRGIWAPSFRYHNGKFYIFSNVNGRTVQVFTANDPRGPWTQHAMKVSLHDLSVLFDDDGKTWVVWGYKGLRMARLNDDLTDIVPGTERQIVNREAGLGEGAHIYKLNGIYYILTAWWDRRMRMPAARARSLDGPWEVNPAISIDEDFGLAEGNRLVNDKQPTPPFEVRPGNPAPRGRMSLHQGGIVQTPAGEWWGFSMMDYNSVGRLLALSPITWKDGWPYFGLPGNLGRTPRTWVKPAGAVQPIRAPYERSDDFAVRALKPIWQWNHVPVDGRWSLTERPGFLRLHTLPATSFWDARNSLTQRAIGPMSRPTALLDVGGLAPGDVAGLALLSQPYAWIGVERDARGLSLVQFDLQTGATARQRVAGTRVWLRADCNYMTEKARFSYSTDGRRFRQFGREFTMIFQGRTFQGVRYTLFAYNRTGVAGGHADFDSFDVFEPHPRGLMRPIPYGRRVTLASQGKATGLRLADEMIESGAPTALSVEDMKLGRVALRGPRGYIAVAANGMVRSDPHASSRDRSFQWIETPTGELALMSLASNRFLAIDPATGVVRADRPGPQPGGRDGVRFIWTAK